MAAIPEDTEGGTPAEDLGDSTGRASLGQDRQCHTDQASISGEPFDDGRNGDEEQRQQPQQQEQEPEPQLELDEFGLPVKSFKNPFEDDKGSEDGYDSAPEQAPSVQEHASASGSERPDVDNRLDDDLREPEYCAEQSPLPSETLGKPVLSADPATVAAAAAPTRPSTVDGESITAGDIPSPEINGKRESKERPISEKMVLPEHLGASLPVGGASEWSHQQVVPQANVVEDEGKVEHEWQEMPAFAAYDIYDDDGKLVAREAQLSDDEAQMHAGLGGAAKGYTKVNMDEDAESASSMDENTRYLFKETGTHVAYEGDDEEARDPLAQLRATKDLLTEQQRIAYVAVVRVAMVLMAKELEKMASVKGNTQTLKELGVAAEAMRMWGQKMMVRLYAHMEVSSDEQLMIEQLAEHGVEPGDLTPTLMQNARVKNPMAEEDHSQMARSTSSSNDVTKSSPANLQSEQSNDSPSPPPYEEHDVDEFQAVQSPSQLPTTKNLDIDLRWTVLCDLFLVLIADSVYDARSRLLLERVGSFLKISWLEICKFEKRVTDALEMQQAADKENWNEDEHMENRRKMAIKRRIMMMGLATVGGSLVIGLSAGLLAPVIGAGLAAGFTTIGVAGTSGFLAGAGGAAVITTTGVLTGGAIAVKSASRRMGSVKTFEYRPLHNNKRVNLIVTVSGWMNGKVDDVRLPYSTVDPVMGDIYSVLWEPEMLQSMGQTINILATEALTQGLQQVLGSTVLVALMASLQLPIVLTKLSYLIDNPWAVSLDRAYSAGLILADSLIDRNLGVRPVTLVGFSLGSRVIFSCLKELANKGAFGLVQNVYLFGSPVVAKKDEYLRARSVVAGRFVNGYAKNDWILGYLFRATSGGIMRVAGLAPVEEIPGLENIDVTDLVAGHMAYRAAMPRLLRELGWSVTGDEFAEIEDPDPDNHQERQREIIAEIDEARKELEKEPKKRRFGFFTRNKKLAERKEWEMYDETAGRPRTDKSGRQSEERKSNVLFDIDAIRRELESEDIEVREIESTLPPMRLDIRAANGQGEPAAVTPYSNVRATKSFDGGLKGESRGDPTLSSPSLAYHGSASPGILRQAESEVHEPDKLLRGSEVQADRMSRAATPSPKPTIIRPELKASVSMPATVSDLEHNAWLEEELELGREQEITLSFE